MITPSNLNLTYIAAASVCTGLLIHHPKTNLPHIVNKATGVKGQVTLTITPLDCDDDNNKESISLEPNEPVNLIRPVSLSELLGDGEELTQLEISALDTLNTINVAGGLIKTESGEYFPFTDLDEDIPWTDLGDSIVALYESLKESKITSACLVIGDIKDYEE
tara:strand:- start:872 stop:1360 length:489 start_codon:yes stop_codon:yes gene_type:complete